MKRNSLQMTVITLLLAAVIINPAYSDDSNRIVNTIDRLDANINYIMNSYFNLIYYKDRIELEMKHHGDNDPLNPVMVDTNDHYNESLKQFNTAIDSIQSQRIELTEKERTELFREHINISKGSRLIGLFMYIMIASKQDLPEMKKYFIETVKSFEKSGEIDRLSIVKSWKTNAIPIPMRSADGAILWKRMTPFDFIHNKVSE